MNFAFALLLACADPPARPTLPPLPPRPVVTEPTTKREPRPLKQFTVAFTGDVRGEIAPCGCPTVPYGGFARRERYLDGLREEDVPLFVLDAGQMLAKGPGTPDAMERGRVLLELSGLVGLDAWAVGPIDLFGAGTAQLARSGALSANWRTPAGTAPFPAAKVIERGGVRLGVVGLSGATPDHPSADPIAAVRSAMAGQEADAWVLLSNATAATTLTVAEQVPEIGVVLAVADDTREPVTRTAGAPIVETPSRGRFVTVVRAFLASTPGPWDFVERGTAAQVAQLIATAPRGANPATRAATGDRLAAARERLTAEIPGLSLATLDHRPLGSDLDGAGDVETRLATFRRQSVDLAKERTQTPDHPRYGTTAACARCHTDRVATWAFQPHARAEEALIQRGSLEDPECVGCHTTGWGRPGGNAELGPSAMATWKSVQCEACHGPMGTHPEDGKAPAAITEATCVACHDPANSPQFDYATWRKRISCVLMNETPGP